MKDRFGVVNTDKRKKFGKEFHIPYGYDYVSYNKSEAITVCRRKNNNFIVERIYDDYGMTKKEEVFRK